MTDFVPTLVPVLVPRRAETDLDRLKRLALAGVSSEETRRAYGGALTDFLLWFQAEPRGPFARGAVQEYRAKLESDGLAPSSVNVRLSAVRKLAAVAAGAGFLSDEAAAGIAQVPGAAQRGVREGIGFPRNKQLRCFRRRMPERSAANAIARSSVC